MNKSRKLNLFDFIGNILIIVLEIIGFYFLATTSDLIGLKGLKYYTILTAVITLLACVLMLFSNIVNLVKGKDATPRLFFTLRFLSATMNFVTVITVAAIISPMSGQFELIYSTEQGWLFFHLLCPILSFLCFVLFEIEPKAKFKKTFGPFIFTTLYAIVILTIAGVIYFQKGVDECNKFLPYPFLKLLPDLCTGDENNVANIFISLCVLLSSFVFAIITWGANRIFSSIIIGYEYNKESDSYTHKQRVEMEKQSENNSSDTRKEKVKKYIIKKVSFSESKPSTMVYHISYHDRKLHTWKVKSEGALRAVKVFPTQKEAIEYANSLVNKNGGSIRIHSMIGRIRKEW